MRNVTTSWLAAISHARNGAGDADVLEKPFPVLPWLTMTLDPRLMALMDQIGIVKTFEADEYLLDPNEAVNKVAYVRRGVTGRSAGDPHGQKSLAIAISTPGRIAYGNLNFFTERHAIGRYFSLTPGEIVVCDRKLLYSLILKDPVLLELTVKQFECCMLSDRLAFASLALLNAEDRLKAFGCTWAANYGERVVKEDGDWIKMPAPMSRRVRTAIISVSGNWLDGKLQEWMKEGVWIRDGDWVWVRPAFLEPVYTWMLRAEGRSVRFDYPEHLSDLIR